MNNHIVSQLNTTLGIKNESKSFLKDNQSIISELGNVDKSSFMQLLKGELSSNQGDDKLSQILNDIVDKNKLKSNNNNNKPLFSPEFNDGTLVEQMALAKDERGKTKNEIQNIKNYLNDSDIPANNIISLQNEKLDLNRPNIKMVDISPEIAQEKLHETDVLPDIGPGQLHKTDILPKVIHGKIVKTDDLNQQFFKSNNIQNTKNESQDNQNIHPATLVSDEIQESGKIAENSKRSSFFVSNSDLKKNVMQDDLLQNKVIKAASGSSFFVDSKNHLKVMKDIKPLADREKNNLIDNDFNYEFLNKVQNSKINSKIAALNRYLKNNGDDGVNGHFKKIMSINQDGLTKIDQLVVGDKQQASLDDLLVDESLDQESIEVNKSNLNRPKDNLLKLVVNSNSNTPRNISNNVSNEKVLDVGNLSQSALIDKIVNYIDEQSVISNRSLKLDIIHQDLGKFQININKENQHNNLISLKIVSENNDACDFFTKNKVELIQHLNNSGIKLLDVVVKNTATADSSLNDFNQNEDSQTENYNNKSNNSKADDSGGREKRREMWNYYKERMAS